MDFKKIKNQIDYELFVALGYSQRKVTKRIVSTITSQVFKQLKNRFKLNGRFKNSEELEKALGIDKKISYTYPDQLKVEIGLRFRVTQSKTVNLDGPHTSFPELVIYLHRKESKSN